MRYELLVGEAPVSLVFCKPGVYCRGDELRARCNRFGDYALEILDYFL